MVGAHSLFGAQAINVSIKKNAELIGIVRATYKLVLGHHGPKKCLIKEEILSKRRKGRWNCLSQH